MTPGLPLALGFGIVKRELRGPGTIDAVGAYAIIPWDDIRDVMTEVKRDGKLKREETSGLEYLQIE